MMGPRGAGASDTGAGNGTHTAAPSTPSVARLASNPRLPLPARTRIVREIQHDLSELATRLVERGLAPDEAKRRAAEALVPVGAALDELERLALPRYRRITDSIDPRRVRLAERTALCVATLVLVVLEASTLLGAGLLADPSPYLWFVLATGTASLAMVIAKAFQFWIKGAHDRPRRGIALIALLSIVTLGIGCAGVLLDLVALATTVESAPERAVALSTAWLVRGAALLSTAIILAVSGALGWLALSGWITWVEHAHEEALGTPSNLQRKETSS